MCNAACRAESGVFHLLLADLQLLLRLNALVPPSAAAENTTPLLMGLVLTFLDYSIYIIS